MMSKQLLEYAGHLSALALKFSADKKGFFMPNTACNKVGDERDNAERQIAAPLCGEYIPRRLRQLFPLH